MKNEGSGIIAPWRRSGVVLRLPCLPGELVRFKGLQTHWVVSAINLYAEGKPTASVTNGKITQTMPLTELADADFAGRIGHPVIIPPGMTAWIPASKQLPDEDAVSKHWSLHGEDPKYIVMINGGIFPTILSFDGNYFYDEETKEPYGVTCWMELPAPPATTPQSACPADSSPDKGSQGDAEKETI